jgi:hypothetical protein
LSRRQLLAHFGTKRSGGARLLCPRNSDVNLFRYGQSTVDLDAKVPNGAFDLCLCMSKQELHSVQITGAPVDQGGLGPAQRMGAEKVSI